MGDAPGIDLSAFVCRRCGACCRVKGGLVRIDMVELEPMAKALGLDVETFIDRWTDLAPDRAGLVLKDAPDGSCALLDEKGLCRIHEAKPRQCRSFPYGWTNPGSFETCPGLRALAEAAGAKRASR